MLDVCEGWMPIGGLDSWTGIKSALSDLPARAADAGRDPQSIEISMCVDEVPPPSVLEDMQASGVKRIILDLASQDRDVTLAELDRVVKATT